ncbi:MAG TPA: hypothetical protein VF190_06160, partial [Rhodothermales bacterium]
MRAVEAERSMGLVSPTTQLTATDRIGLVLVGAGLLALLVVTVGRLASSTTWLLAGIGALAAGALLYFGRHLRKPPGTRNDGQWQSRVTGLGAFAWVMAVVFT